MKDNTLTSKNYGAHCLTHLYYSSLSPLLCQFITASSHMATPLPLLKNSPSHTIYSNHHTWVIFSCSPEKYAIQQYNLPWDWLAAQRRIDLGKGSFAWYLGWCAFGSVVHLCPFAVAHNSTTYSWRLCSPRRNSRIVWPICPAFFIANVILTPIIEENIFRGFALSQLRKRFSPPSHSSSHV